MMKSNEADRVATVFDRAVELGLGDRMRYLAAACRDDRALQEQVESLLCADEDATSFLDADAGVAAESAERILGGSSADHAGMIGGTVGGYRLIGVLGVGGMSVVYLAEQESPRRHVALKIIKPGWASDSMLRRFRDESQILARLRHPGIAQIFEAGTADTGFGVQPFFVMELVEGLPLTRYAQEHGLDSRQRLELFRLVCDAVHHAHRKGVVHRDLKPDNILVDENGQPKVLDFGVARVTDSDVQRSTLQTGLGELIGTLPYMSPEQTTGDPDGLDVRADVYALGVLAYELLAGRLPLDLTGRQIPEAIRLIQETDPPPLSVADCVFRGDLDTIVGKALEKERTRRYASAFDLSVDIRRYLDDEPILARPASTVYQLRKFARRNRAMVGGTVAVFATLVAGIAAASMFAVGEANQRELAFQRLGEAEAAQQESESVTQFVVDMLAAAEPHEQGREVRVVDVLDDASTRIGADFAEQPRLEVRLRSTLGSTYMGLGKYDEATKELERANSLAGKTLTPEDALTLETMSLLGMAYCDQGRFDDAQPLLETAFERRRDLLGSEHPDTVNAMGSLGSLYRFQGRLDEAHSMLAEVLASTRLRHGDTHRGTLICLDNLANVYMGQGRYADAEPLYEESLEGSRATLGPDDPTTLITTHNLAGAYIMTGRRDEAEPLLVDMIERSRVVFGDEHHWTLAATGRLAYLMGVTKRYAEAERLYTKTLETQRRALPEDHYYTLLTQDRLFDVLVKQEKLEEASPVGADLAARYEREYGLDDERTRTVIGRLAELHDAIDDVSAAAIWRARLPADESSGPARDERDPPRSEPSYGKSRDS